jgi:uncharacterized membrane protein YbhN (UPF0104 family)
VLVALVVAAQLASYGLRALRVYLAEPRIPRGAWGKALRLILLNNALNLLLPARTGEASFPLLLQRYFGVPLAEGAGTLLWLRLLDLNVLGVLALLTFAPAVWPSAGPVWTATALVVASIPFAMPLLHQSLSRSLSARTGRASALARQLLVGVPCRARQVLLDLVLTWAAWGVKLAALAAVFAALAALPLKAALLGAIGGDLSTVLPLHTPGGFGSYEAGVIALAAPLAAPSPALLAAAVNLHVLVLGIALAAGALAWLAGVRKSAT